MAKFKIKQGSLMVGGRVYGKNDTVDLTEDRAKAFGLNNLERMASKEEKKLVTNPKRKSSRKTAEKSED